MKDAKTLYQELVLDHGKAPRNEGPLEGATNDATAKNPLCGDKVTVHFVVNDGVIESARFEARGCMIMKASASLLTETVRGKSVEDAQNLAKLIEALAVGEAPEDVGPLEPLRGVKEFPARRACVTLAWHALESALGSG